MRPYDLSPHATQPQYRHDSNLDLMRKSLGALVRGRRSHCGDPESGRIYGWDDLRYRPWDQVSFGPEPHGRPVGGRAHASTSASSASGAG